jgi:hypothetical protein
VGPLIEFNEYTEYIIQCWELLRLVASQRTVRVSLVKYRFADPLIRPPPLTYSAYGLYVRLAKIPMIHAKDKHQGYAPRIRTKDTHQGYAPRIRTKDAREGYAKE